MTDPKGSITVNVPLEQPIRASTEQLDELDLLLLDRTRMDFEILAELEQYPSLRESELARKLGVKQQALNPHTRHLEEWGLVSALFTNKRTKFLRLTETGRVRLHRAFRTIASP